MKSVTFACKKNAEEIQEALEQHRKSFQMRFLTSLSGLCILPVVYYLEVSQLDGNPNRDAIVTEFLIMFSVIGVFFLLVAWYFYINKEKGHVKFDMFPYKQFSWSEETKTLTYKDDHRELRFRGEDVRKWSSYSVAQRKVHIDIMQLKTGERFVLEGDWNEEVHSFLANNRISLGLPEPSGMVWMLDIYKED